MNVGLAAQPDLAPVPHNPLLRQATAVVRNDETAASKFYTDAVAPNRRLLLSDQAGVLH
jgi:hypothetical protein